jgi:4'-phosphopantetheinyl transferase
MASHLVVRACPPFGVSGVPGVPETAVAAAASSELEREARSLLDGAELERARAMTPRTRQEFLAGRLAQRRFAAGLLGVPPAGLTAWYSCPRCGTGADISHGKPGYRLRGDAVPLLLSLSRAAGWTLLTGLVDPEPGQRLGIDVEDPARADFDGFDDVVLTAAEQLHLAGLDGIFLLRGRARLWARKEAWLKMLGTGLQTAPDTLDVLGPDVDGRAGLRDLAPAETGLPADLVAAVAVAVLP